MEPVLAQEGDGLASSAVSRPQAAKAEVISVLMEKEIVRVNGSKTVQQNLQLGILSGELKGNKVEYYGISDVDVVSNNYYKKGDKVWVSYSQDESGKNVFYVTDYVRGNSLLWLLLLFIAVVLLIGRKKGMWALLSLLASFFLITKVLVPLVFMGYNPLLVGIIVSMLVLTILIYMTEGINKKAHVCVAAIAASLLVTTILAVAFGYFSRLSGASQEEVTYLIDVSKKAIDFKGLLFAAILIGTLGVLDDVVIGQVEAVEQIREANSGLSDNKVFNMAMKVGRAHLGAIINTLFLAYAGASLPLILLFQVHQEPFLSFSQVINNEEIATEIVRTLVGVIGLCLAAPVSTLMAIKYSKKYDHSKN